MERGKTIPTSRWPDWLNAAGLLAASWIAIAALSLQARPGAEVVAVAFPPWWGAQQAMVAAGSAMAADMPLRAIAPVSTYDWSGMYIGGVLGGAWATNDIADPGLGILGTLIGVPVIQTTNSSGFIGGIEGGSNYQFGNLVVGWEGDITWGSVNGTSTTSFGAPLLPPGVLTRSIAANTNCCK